MASRRKAPLRGRTPAVIGGLTEALHAVSAWLGSEQLSFAVVGGVAASLHGRPRLTKDVDVVVLADDASWGALVQAGAEHGLRPRISDALAFAKKTRVLLLVHEPSKIEVDVSFGMLPFEADLVQRAEVVEVGKVRFPLATPEDVIVMKSLALRPRDIADIEGIVESVQKLDLRRIRETLAQLSAALEGDDHVAKLEEILRAVSRPPS